MHIVSRQLIALPLLAPTLAPASKLCRKFHSKYRIRVSGATDPAYPCFTRQLQHCASSRTYVRQQWVDQSRQPSHCGPRTSRTTQRQTRPLLARPQHDQSEGAGSCEEGTPGDSAASGRASSDRDRPFEQPDDRSAEAGDQSMVAGSAAGGLLTAVPGQAIVLGVACLWGTNPIALRYLYRGEGAHFGQQTRLFHYNCMAKVKLGHDRRACMCKTVVVYSMMWTPCWHLAEGAQVTW